MPSAALREVELPAPIHGAVGLTALLCQAIDRCGVQKKAAAIAQGYDPGYWSHIRSGEKAAQLDRCDGLDLDVQRVFVIAWANRIGLTCYADDPKIAAFKALVTAAQRCQDLLETELQITQPAPRVGGVR